MGTGENPNLPQRTEYAPVEIASRFIPTRAEVATRGFWKAFFLGMGSLVSVEFGFVLIDRGFEVSGVKPNIIHACIYWFGAWGIFSFLIWLWTWGIARSRKVKIAIGSVPPISLVLIVAIIRPWVIEEYRAEHAPPPPDFSADTHKAATNMLAMMSNGALGNGVGINLGTINYVYTTNNGEIFKVYADFSKERKTIQNHVGKKVREGEFKTTQIFRLESKIIVKTLWVGATGANAIYLSKLGSVQLGEDHEFHSEQGLVFDVKRNATPGDYQIIVIHTNRDMEIVWGVE